MKKTIAVLMIATLWLGGCSSRNSDEGATQNVTAGEPGIGAATAAPTANANAVTLFSNPPALLTGDETRALVTAVVTDDQNRAIEGYEVNFSSNGGLLQNIQATTNEAGEATAELNLAGNYHNTNVVVTAGVGDATSDITVVSQGSEITMTAPSDLIVGQTARLEFSLLSGAGTGIPNEVIEFSSQAGNTFSQNSAVTDARGFASVSLSTSAGSDVISAIALDSTVVSSTPLTVAENIQAIVEPVLIRVISNESVIETGGNDIARITTLVTDEDNRVISGKEVTFSSTGGILQNIAGVTNEAGQAIAELSLAGDYRNQDITVTATVDDQSGDVVVSTVGSKISVAGPTALVSGDTADLEITLVGGNDQPIANENVSVRSSAGNTIQPATAVTDANGKVTITVSSENGSDTITVAALGNTVVTTHDLQVAADVLTVLPGSFDSLPVSSFSPMNVEWTSNGLPVVGQLMRFSTTAGVVRAAGTGAAGSSSIDVYTDASGLASVELSSNSAGPATVSFADSQDNDPASQFDVEFVATLPADISLEATPASVATGNASTVSATVVDAFGNPVKDTVVEFSSPDLRGGSLSPVSAVTDKDGNASITFDAGNLPTEVDGITISAKANDYPAVTPADVKMTVTERQLNVIIGLAGQIVEQQSDTRYSKTGVVQVTDGAGRPVPDATILMSLRPLNYTYGLMLQEDTDDDDNEDRWVLYATATCLAEDTNGNRLLDLGEDSNGNGILDPRDPALIDSDPENLPTVIGGQITTDASGAGFFTIVYPQSNALYFDVAVTARVEALGTEAVTEYRTVLSMSASDAANLDASPPNSVSPFGILPLTQQQSGCFYNQEVIDIIQELELGL